MGQQSGRGQFLAGVAFALVFSSQAQGAILDTPGAKAWAQKVSQYWRELRFDSRGQRLWDTRTLDKLSESETITTLIAYLREAPQERRAALILLGEHPLEQWAEKALKLDPPAALGHNSKRYQQRIFKQTLNARDEVAHFLYLRGYRRPGNDPTNYLEPSKETSRPWIQGLGLHLSGTAWRFQWIPSPALMSAPGGAWPMPEPVKNAPQSSVLIHARELRTGLLRLRALAGGGSEDGGNGIPGSGIPGGGIVNTLAQGTRSGFLLRHLEPWLKEGNPALDALAKKEAWVLHYGVPRDSYGPSEGTLVFLPGDLPTASKLGLTLLKLNPLSKGARSRTITWSGSVGKTFDLEQVRGSGGVLHIARVPGGTWISDREDPLRRVLFPQAEITFQERSEWCKVALAAMQPQTEVSFWVAPRLSASAAFERQALRRGQIKAVQGTWPNPFIAKAAPRGGVFSVSLGAGPTEQLLNSILRVDDETPIELPEMPEFAEGGKKLTPEQKRDFQIKQQQVRDRREVRKALRAELAALQPLLDPRGAALFMNGWNPAPPLSPKETTDLAEYRRLKKLDSAKADKFKEDHLGNLYGSFAEPGLSPSLALAIPLQAGKGPQAETALGKLVPKLFRGLPQVRNLSPTTLHRVATAQSFVPCYAVVKDTLILSSDAKTAETVIQGMLGNGPTLADTTSSSFGRAELDGDGTSKALEQLLLSYLRVNMGGGGWWWMPPDPQMGADEAGAEVATSFGPFLGALRSLGKVGLQMDWGPGGLEVKPR